MRRPFLRIDDGSALPQLAHGTSSISARALAAQIPEAIAQAEALGAMEVAVRLRTALKAAQRLAADGQPSQPFDGGALC